MVAIEQSNMITVAEVSLMSLATIIKSTFNTLKIKATPYTKQKGSVMIPSNFFLKLRQVTVRQSMDRPDANSPPLQHQRENITGSPLTHQWPENSDSPDSGMMMLWKDRLVIHIRKAGKIRIKPRIGKMIGRDPRANRLARQGNPTARRDAQTPNTSQYVK